MNYIAHRINTVEELKKLDTQFGVEIDLRDSGSDLILQHDPFVDGDRFEEYLKEYNHGTMILNVKSERIEHRILDLLKAYNIDDYFFLDSSFPMIYELSRKGESKIALRFSEFEGLDTIRNMAGKVEWIWVDCFSRLPITYKNYIELKEMGYRLCLVSPELQQQESKIVEYKEYLNEQGILFDAICTKFYNVGKWEK